MGAVQTLSHADESLTRARAIAGSVVDPEIPVLTIADLGVLRAVDWRDGTLVVTITPTYSGCPAMTMIAETILETLKRAGFGAVRVEQVLSPAWTTDWLSEDGKSKLIAYGIAPPPGKAGRRALFGTEDIACPHCGSGNTEKISEFGSTACKAHWRCLSCREPFDAFKCL